MCHITPSCHVTLPCQHLPCIALDSYIKFFGKTLRLTIWMIISLTLILLVIRRMLISSFTVRETISCLAFGIYGSKETKSASIMKTSTLLFTLLWKSKCWNLSTVSKTATIKKPLVSDKSGGTYSTSIG